MSQISIVIPAYNSEDYLTTCLNTLMEQSFSDFEIIVVNDGSTDKTEEICRSYASKDSRIKLISKKNGGVSSARNVGLDNAKGEWVTFVDADDTLPHNALDTLYSKISDDIDIIFAGYNIVKDNQIIPGPEPREQEMTNTELAIELFSPTERRYLGYVWAKFYRRSVIQDNNIRFDEAIKYNEDRLFTFEFLSKARIGIYSTTPGYNYILRATSAMASINGPRYYLFETDLDAFILMKEIAPRFNNTVEKLVRKGTFESYKWNKRLNKQYGGNNPQTNERLKQKLHSVVPYSSVLFWNLEDKAREVMQQCPTLKKFLKKLATFHT